MKAAIAGTSDFQSQSMFDQLAPADPFRGPRASRVGGMGMIADMNLSAAYRWNEVMALRIGYNLLWLTGIALGPDQWDFSSNPDGGQAVSRTGSVYLAGASLGIEARW